MTDVDPYTRRARCNVRDCGNRVSNSSPTRCVKHELTQTCRKRIKMLGRTSSNLCNRVVEDEGLCARHLSGKRRSDAVRARHQAMAREEREQHALAVELADELSELLGVKLQPGNRGAIVLSESEATRLLAHLRDTHAGLTEGERRE